MSAQHNVWVTKCLSDTMSGCQNVSATQCLGVKMFVCQIVKVSKCWGVKMSRLQNVGCRDVGEPRRATIRTGFRGQIALSVPCLYPAYNRLSGVRTSSSGSVKTGPSCIPETTPKTWEQCCPRLFLSPFMYLSLDCTCPPFWTCSNDELVPIPVLVPTLQLFQFMYLSLGCTSHHLCTCP